MVNEGQIADADLYIKNGRIENIASSLSSCSADRTIDAGGKLLLPGMIDCHVHFREPGLENKADMHSESVAAAAGGVTSIMEMPNTKTGSRHPRCAGRQISARIHQVRNQLFILSRGLKQQSRRIAGHGPENSLRSKALHGRIDRKPAGRPTAAAGRYFRTDQGADCPPLRRYQYHS